jgi:hypothetical protein
LAHESESGREHATEFRKREIGDSFCIEPGCRYEGQLAVQGHCYAWIDKETERYLRDKERGALSILTSLREHHPDLGDYVKSLESYYICSWMNGEFMLDELVQLRRDNADLRQRPASA